MFASFAPMTAQETDSVMVPTRNGKVLFTDTVSVNGTSDEIYSKLSKWLSLHLSTRKGAIIQNDKVNKEISFRVFDYMEIEKRALSMFSIYMKYIAHVSYKDGLCTIEVGGIKYIEPDEIEKDTPYIIDGEELLLEKKYKVVFVTDAAEKIKIHSIKEINKLFDSLHKALE